MSLNDPQWGRDSSDDEPRKDDRATRDRREAQNDQEDDRRDENRLRQKPNPNSDKDELDREIERLWHRIESALGGFTKKDAPRSSNPRSKLKSRDDFSRDDFEEDSTTSTNNYRAGGNEPPSPPENGQSNPWRDRIPPVSTERLKKGGGLGLGVLLALVVAGWAATGFYIVPEGQAGIVTTFGRYSESTAPGFRWHMPLPIQDVQLVDVSSVRTAEIGSAGQADRLREALMLTDDENIVDMQFTVQYRIKPGLGARDYVFRLRYPERTVVQTAESAMREVVGRKTMDSVLFESKAEIAEDVRKLMQEMLDRYNSGIEVMSVAIQNAQPPQQVQAAFNDAVKAGQDRERSINLGEEYRNAVLPKAQGTAARLKEDALGYQARVTEMARGDAARFAALQAEYAKAPTVTRDRLYIDTMREVLSNATKVYVDSKSGNNMLYLPLDKIVKETKQKAQEQVNTQTPDPNTVMGAAATQTSTSAPSNNYNATSDRSLSPRSDRGSVDPYRLTRTR